MSGPYGPLWLTYKYTEHCLVYGLYYYYLSPTFRYLHTTGTKPNRSRPYWKIPWGIAQRNTCQDVAYRLGAWI